MASRFIKSIAKFWETRSMDLFCNPIGIYWVYHNGYELTSTASCIIWLRDPWIRKWDNNFEQLDGHLWRAKEMYLPNHLEFQEDSR
jgi:hypothetical protein